MTTAVHDARALGLVLGNVLPLEFAPAAPLAVDELKQALLEVIIPVAKQAGPTTATSCDRVFLFLLASLGATPPFVQ